MDRFELHQDAVSAPARHAFAVTPNDDADLPAIPKALYVGVGGDVTVRCVDSATAVTFTGVSAGLILPIRAARIMNTGTSAAQIVALV